MKIPNETKVGALVVIAVVLLILGFNLLKGNAILSSSTTLYAVYHEVDGLAAANPVRVNGLKVGSVADLNVMNEQAGAILVELTIKSNIKIPSNSVARIENSDLLGSKQVVLEFGNANTFLQNKDTISGTVSTPITSKLADKLDPISDKIQTTLTVLDTVLGDIHSSLDTKTQNNLRSSIASFSEAMQHFASTSSKLDTLVNGFNIFMDNINAQNHSINEILSNTQTATAEIADADLKGTIRNLDTTVTNLNEVLVKINEGGGSLGLLMNDEHLYKNLQSATYNLTLLLEDLRLNPKKYVHFSLFGGKSKTKPLPSDTLK